jgi:hypothetical protein
MSFDPEPPECCCCLANLSPPNNWVCGKCIEIAAQLGYEIDGFTHPGDAIAEAVWKKVLEMQRAQTS